MTEKGSLDISTIYKYDTHRNIPWNIVQYQPNKQYLGKAVSFAENRYVTKRGFYMDPHIKYVKPMPSPDKYPSKSLFDQTQNKKYSQKVKINPRLKKNSYHDQITLQGKKTKIGVGSYYLDKTDKQRKQQLQIMKKKNKVDKSPRPSFYQDTQVKTQVVPGPGAHNPHLSVDHIRQDRMKPQKWVEKHKKQGSQFIKKAKKKPGPSSYRPVSAGTFDHRKASHQKEQKKKGKSTSTGFGTDAKFQYERPNKKVVKEERPSFFTYDLRIKWNGKKDEVKKHGWSTVISGRPSSASVYH